MKFVCLYHQNKPCSWCSTCKKIQETELVTASHDDVNMKFVCLYHQNKSCSWCSTCKMIQGWNNVTKANR